MIHMHMLNPNELRADGSMSRTNWTLLPASSAVTLAMPWSDIQSALRDNAFEAELAGMGEDGRAVALDMLVEADAGTGLGQD